MSRNTLLDKIWRTHTAREIPETRETQVVPSIHLVHEVTSAPAFQMLRDEKLQVMYPGRTVATVDHIVPTDNTARPLQDLLAEKMLQHLERNARESGIPLFNMGHENQGIVHVIGPELGLTKPGLFVVCGDSHTSTHGALGCLAFGIGTSQIRDVLATGSLILQRPKVRRIEVSGELANRVTAKDVILAIINRTGVDGGIGYAYEYGGSVIDNMSIEGRLTVCNMSCEGQAQCGYMNPDQRTFDYLRGRKFVPQGAAFDTACEEWIKFASGSDAHYDDVVELKGSDIAPMITWGTNPGQSISVDGNIPNDADPAALEYMGFEAGQQMIGTPINVAFIGSCTGGRFEDFEAAAELIKNYGLKVAPNVRALAVPGSERVRKQVEDAGHARTLSEAGWQWRGAGCSMCLAMNPDKLIGREVSISATNRNFRGRQGSKTGRTLLASPIMVAYCASLGEVGDIRNLN
jgi:3-isopropylmalate/(R)-2-methylmalate dehydratase large subunit